MYADLCLSYVHFLYEFHYSSSKSDQLLCHHDDVICKTIEDIVLVL
jgi:hypothetical protein